MRQGPTLFVEHPGDSIAQEETTEEPLWLKLLSGAQRSRIQNAVQKFGMKGEKGILLLLHSDLCTKRFSKMFGLKVVGLWIK